MERLGRHIAALVAAGIGFYAGLAASVALLGLGGAGEAPLFMASLAGLGSGIAVGLFDGASRLAARSAVGLVAGLLVGAVVWLTDAALEVGVAGVVLISQGLAWWSVGDT